MCALCAAQLALRSGEDAAADAAAVEADGLAQSAPAGAEASALRLHAALLRALSALRRGDTKSAGACAAQLPALLAASRGAAGYSWAASPAVAALVHCVSASAERPWSEKQGSAREHASAALALTAAALADLGIDVAGDSDEADVSFRAAALARPLLVLRLAALETGARCSLLACELARAGREAAEAAALAQRFPAALGEAAGTARLLAGLYAHSCAHYDVAAAHFAAAEGATAPPLAPLCRVQRAVSLLCASAPGCEGAALDALGPLARDAPGAATHPGVAEAAGAAYAASLAALRRGDVAEAKVRLGKALKHAHGDLGSHELVAASLVALGALVEASGDGSQARDMLTSAFTLAKAAGDAAAQAGALTLLARVHAGAGATSDEAGMTRYSARKRAVLATARAEAEADEPIRKKLLSTDDDA